VEKFSCEGQCQDSLQDTPRFAGTKEDALHPAVLLGRTRSAKFAALLARCTPSLQAFPAVIIITVVVVVIIIIIIIPH